MNDLPKNLRAEKRWRGIPKDMQAKILVNVWCSKCRVGTPIKAWTLGVEDDVVIIKGECSICGGDCVRVLEEE